MPSQLQQTIQEYRQRLLAHERTAMASLDYAHKQTLALIEPQLNALFDKMTQAMQNGEDISKSWLYEQNRLQAITDYISNNIDHYAAMSQMQVAQLQQSGVQLGQQAAMALLDASKPPSVNFSFGVPSPDAIAGMVGATQAGSPLADLFAGFGQEAAQAAKNALISGVTLGYNPRQIAPMVQQALDVSRNRALVISRTEMLRSYKNANTETFRANSDVVDQWRWTAALSARTCAACLAMDGSLHDLSEDLESHPCCRCTAVPVTKSWDDILGAAGIDATGIEDTNPASDMQTGEDWFNKQDASTQQSILGKSKYEAFADGKFTLQDVVGHSHDSVWGDSIYERSLKDTLEAASKAPTPVEEKPQPEPEPVQEVKPVEPSPVDSVSTDLPPKKYLEALGQAMQDKYPDTVFSLAGADPVAMERTMRQLDTLMSKYPEVAKSVPYVGTGGQLPADLKAKGFHGVTGRTFAAVERVGGASVAESPLFFNKKFYSDAKTMEEKIAHLGEVGWFTPAANEGLIEYIVTHEFGHIIDNYISIEGSLKSFMGFINSDKSEGEVSSILGAFKYRNRDTGRTISQYAKTNTAEQWAEGFASLYFTPKDEQPIYVRKLGEILDQLLPDGSPAAWTSVKASGSHWEPGYQWTAEEKRAWDKFAQEYIY